MAPDDDVWPHIIISTPHPPYVVIAELPAITDAKAKARIACRFVPALLLAHEATACALVLPCWASVKSRETAGRHDFVAASQASDRRDILMAELIDGEGREAVLMADVLRLEGRTPRLSPWSRRDGGGLSLFMRPARVALGLYQADVVAAVPEASPAYPAVVMCEADDDDVRARLKTAVDDWPQNSVPPRGGFSTFNGKSVLSFLACSEEDRNTMVSRMRGCSARMVDISVDTRCAILKEDAMVGPLVAAGYSPAEACMPTMLSEDEKEVIGRTLAGPVLRSVGRNDPCPCGSGVKFKKCCHA